MMYSNKLAVAIKTAQHKVLREFEDTVYIPFGEEYSIFVKNLNSVRASVKVSIDGEDVGGGNAFVVDANGTVDIQRFIKNGNLSEGNRLKFIERTGAIEQHRGVGIEDGLVRVEFQFEKPAPLSTWNTLNVSRTYFGGDTGDYKMSKSLGNSRGFAPSSSAGCEEYTCDSFSMQSADVLGVACSAQANETGITVPGSISDQGFNQIAAFPLESATHVIVLKLLGQTETVKVVAPVTVKAKPKCTSCGRVNKATAKYCNDCGTSLTVV